MPPPPPMAKSSIFTCTAISLAHCLQTRRQSPRCSPSIQPLFMRALSVGAGRECHAEAWHPMMHGAQKSRGDMPRHGVFRRTARHVFSPKASSGSICEHLGKARHSRQCRTGTPAWKRRSARSINTYRTLRYATRQVRVLYEYGTVESWCRTKLECHSCHRRDRPTPDSLTHCTHSRWQHCRHHYFVAYSISQPFWTEPHEYCGYMHSLAHPSAGFPKQNKTCLRQIGGWEAVQQLRVTSSPRGPHQMGTRRGHAANLEGTTF